MKKIWITLCLALLPLYAAAEGPELFRGSWEGRGTYIFNGKMSQCGEFRLIFDATQSSFEFVSGDRKCDYHEEKFDNVKMDYRDGALYFYGQKVGEVNGNELTAAYSVPEGNGRVRHWRMLMRRQGDHLMYEESRRMDNEATPLISFAGLLQRSER